MKRKRNIWNAPLRQPSQEAQDYARKYYKRPQQKVNSPQPEGVIPTLAPKPSVPPLVEPPVPELVEPEEKKVEEEQTEVVKRYKVLKRRQRRRQAMSISVSEEEEELLRAGAAADGMTFSAWARKCLFRAMKSKIPNRPE